MKLIGYVVADKVNTKWGHYNVKVYASENVAKRYAKKWGASGVTPVYVNEEEFIEL